MGGFCCVKIAIFDLQVEEFLVFLSRMLWARWIFCS